MRRSSRSMRFRNQRAGATRLPILVGAITVLAVLGACADGARTVTAPREIQAPRNSRINSGGDGFAGVVQLCVKASSPPGTYRFVNSGFLSGADNGGTGITVENVPDRTPYVVPFGGCLTVETRTVPDTTYPELPDTWSGVTVRPHGIPPGAVFDSINCVLDVGVKDPVPAACGTGNFSTRAFANIDHGVGLLYFFHHRG